MTKITSLCNNLNKNNFLNLRKTRFNESCLKYRTKINWKTNNNQSKYLQDTVLFEFSNSHFFHTVGCNWNNCHSQLDMHTHITSSPLIHMYQLASQSCTAAFSGSVFIRGTQTLLSKHSEAVCVCLYECECRLTSLLFVLFNPWYGMFSYDLLVVW